VEALSATPASNSEAVAAMKPAPARRGALQGAGLSGLQQFQASLSEKDKAALFADEEDEDQELDDEADELFTFEADPEDEPLLDFRREPDRDENLDKPENFRNFRTNVMPVLEKGKHERRMDTLAPRAETGGGALRALLDSPAAARAGLATNPDMRASFEPKPVERSWGDTASALWDKTKQGVANKLTGKELGKTAARAIVPFADSIEAGSNLYEAHKNVGRANELSSSLGTGQDVARAIGDGANRQTENDRLQRGAELATALASDAGKLAAGGTPLGNGLVGGGKALANAGIRAVRQGVEGSRREEARTAAGEGDEQALADYGSRLDPSVLMGQALAQNRGFTPRNVTSMVQAQGASSKAKELLGIAPTVDTQRGVNQADTAKAKKASPKAKKLLGIDANVDTAALAPQGATATDKAKKNVLGQELLARSKETRLGANLRPTHVAASQKGNAAAQQTVDAIDASQVEKLDEIRKNSANDSAAGAGVESLASIAKGTYEHFDPGSLMAGGKDLMASIAAPVTDPLAGLASSALRAVT
jgi:hypothetical protein